MRIPARSHVNGLAAAVVVLAALPYLNGLKNGFTFDDRPIVAENPRIRSFAGIGRAFATDWWDGTRPQSLLYRPLTMATFGVDHAVARGLPSSPALPFHVQNVLWHGAASAALFLLVLEMFASPWLAFAAAALFAVHPVHTEAVDGIVGRSELMAACLGFSALLAARRERPVAAGVLLLAALLSKEQAITIPLIPLLWLPAWKSAGARRVLVGFALAVAAYLVLRTAVLGTPLGGTADPVDNPIAAAAGAARFLTPLTVFGRAAGLLILPVGLSADYSFNQIPLVTSPGFATALCLLALIALIGGGIALRHRAPAAAFGIFFFLLTWLLTSNLPIVIGTIFGERLLYLPSAGVCLAVASGLLALPMRRLRMVALVTLLLAGFVQTWRRNPDWKDNATLFAKTVVTSPRSCKALDGLASELLASGRPREAVPWAQRALAIRPDYPAAHLTLAKCFRLLAGEERDAVRRAELRARAVAEARRVAGERGSADAWSVLGGIALDAGNTEEALSALRKSVELDPGHVPALIGLGVAEMLSGRSEAALPLFERAAEQGPENAEARRNLAAALRALGLLQRADEEEIHAMELSGRAGDVTSLANLHGVRGQRFREERRYDDALAEFREAARLEPRAARAYLGMGTVLATEADAASDAARRRDLVDEAIAAYARAVELEPDDPTAHLNLAIVAMRHARPQVNPAEHLRAYLRLVPDAPQRAQMEATIRELEAPLP